MWLRIVFFALAFVVALVVIIVVVLKDRENFTPRTVLVPPRCVPCAVRTVPYYTELTVTKPASAPVLRMANPRP